MNVPPRRLLVRPQRAPTAVLFTLLSAAFVAVPVGLWAQSVVVSDLGLSSLASLGWSAFGLIFLLVGLHGWFLQVELALHDDGVLVMKWTRWPLGPRVKSLPVADVRDIIVETDDGTSRILVLTASERIPLSPSATSDSLGGKVAEMKVFLGLS